MLSEIESAGESGAVWHVHSFQLVSLLGMLSNYAYLFYSMGQLFMADEELGKRLSKEAANAPLSQESRASSIRVLEIIEKSCKEIGLSDSVLKGVKRTIDEVRKPDTTTGCEFQVMAELERRVNDELSSIYFFHVTQNGAQHYPADDEKRYTKPLLSHRAIKKFPASVEDAEEAGKCFALARYTACVFHLMRVMERGVQRLGKKLKVSIPVEEKDWGQISSHINGALKTLPNSTVKERKAHGRYAKAAVYLDNVREAWRNPTMHPKATYTEEEAEDCFRFVKQYVEYLAKIL